MLAYGLFLARLNSGSESVTLHNAREYIPGSFRLIRELVDFLTELERKEYRDVRWVVEEVLSIVNNLDLRAIHEDLSFRGRKAISRKVRAADEEEHRLFERDPFIYFYEDYLRAYDKETSKSRGVYYTPPPVVNFIVGAIDDILKESFEIPEGLSDHKRVTVLDFACGTGTFLLEVFQRAFENIGGPDSGRADLLVRDHFLKNIFGFEYLIAPYTIAHLKLSQYLKDQGHALKNDKRLCIYLTNTLEPVERELDQKELWPVPALAAEIKAAQSVKEQPILVITGNPPYSAHSKNTGEWITTAIEAYKLVDGEHFGERKHWLHDDYVKFIRFSQMKMDAVPEGIIGVITNHSWLDNPTFRGMRQSLMCSFEQIYVFDLHGNAKKKERGPDGSKDENVFDIEQGVAISFFIKRAGLERGIWRSDLWGDRLTKYRAVADAPIRGIPWTVLDVQSPQYLFKALPSEVEYQRFWAIPEILPDNTPGIITARDRFAIAIEPGELNARIAKLLDSRLSESDIRREFNLKNTRGWSLAEARERLKEAPNWRGAIRTILQAPFDSRHVVYDIRLIDWGRWSFIDRLKGRLLSLCLPRKIDIQRGWEHVFVADELISHHSVSMKEVNYAFPLAIDGHENFSPDFRAFLDSRYDHHYAPDEIFGYIYAVLHAPAYRTRYAEFLRIDFPRIPFPETKAEFDALSKLGWALVQAHLLRDLPRKGLARYHGKGEHEVESVRYDPKDKVVWINKTQFFKSVPQAVWDFHIGGYQVLDKYLKSRKGRKLSLDEINHVATVADVLAFTVEQMAKIDKAYKAAFPERG
ncbi:MAG: type ISP restriction/modification enzyme [Methyloceanibacter sp.]